MFAVRAQGVVRGPFTSLPKNKQGGPTFAGAWEGLRGMARGGPPKKKKGDDKKGTPSNILDGVDFELEPGTITVIPGVDMRAIDTLMRIMTGALEASGGRIEIRGSVAGLVSPGDNLDAELTAYELIRRERNYLRVPDDRVEEFAEAVMDISGLRDFEDVQVRRYSTGMAMRLGVAMILAAKPSVVVLGDILRVGDLDFRQRAVDLIKQMAADGTTFILGGPGFSIDGFADRTILLERGRVTRDSHKEGADAGIMDSGPASHAWHIAEARASSAPLDLVAITVLTPNERRRRTEFKLKWHIKQAPLKMRPIIDILHSGTVVMRSVAPQEIEFTEPRWLTTTLWVPPYLTAITYTVRVLCEFNFQDRDRSIRISRALEAVPTRAADQAVSRRMPLLRPDLGITLDAIGDLKAEEGDAAAADGAAPATKPDDAGLAPVKANDAESAKGKEARTAEQRADRQDRRRARADADGQGKGGTDSDAKGGERKRSNAKHVAADETT